MAGQACPAMNRTYILGGEDLYKAAALLRRRHDDSLMRVALWRAVNAGL